MAPSTEKTHRTTETPPLPGTLTIVEADSRSSGVGLDEAVGRALESVDLQPLVARVLSAASETNSMDTLRLLGSVLGEAVANRPRRIGEDLMLIDGIGGLEPGHLMLLEHLDNPADRANLTVTWSATAIAEVIDGALSPGALQAALGGLVARGLVERVSGLDGGG